MNILYFPRWHFHYRLYLKIAKESRPHIHHILKYGSPSLIDQIYRSAVPNLHLIHFEHEASLHGQHNRSSCFSDPQRYSLLLKYINADIYLSYFHSSRYSGRSRYTELLALSTNLYQYFKHYVVAHRIDRVVSELVGGLPDGILHFVCEELSIPYLALRQSKLSSGVIISDPLIDLPQPGFRLPLELIQRDAINSNFINHVPVYTKYTFKNPIRRIFRKTLFTDLIFFLFWVRAPRSSMMHGYQLNTIFLALSRACNYAKHLSFYRDRSFVIPPDSTYHYLLYPLHYEPESSVLVRGYPHNRQIDLINKLSQYLPPNYILLVKEHSGNPGYRKSSDYKIIRTLPNVTLVPPSTSVKSLLPNLQGLITISGRIGFEFAEKLMPVYLFGRAFYQDYPTVTTHSTFQGFSVWLESLSTRSSGHTDSDITAINKKIDHYISNTMSAYHLGRSNHTFSNKNIERLSRIILSPLDDRYINE